MNSIKLEWKRGDWAAYFGLMTNNLTNLLTMMGLLIFVVGIPTEIVYGRIAPAFGLAVLVASVCYAWFGLQMAKHTGRNDVTALPSGPSAPSIFTVTFLVLMPVYQQTKDANFAIQIALVWCFVEALILVGGSFLGETIRKMIPRTVLLSCLSGLGLLLLAMNPMLQAFEAPTVSFIVLLLIFINWFGKKPIFARIPTGLLLLIAGTALAWISGLQSPEAIKASMSSFGLCWACGLESDGRQHRLYPRFRHHHVPGAAVWAGRVYARHYSDDRDSADSGVYRRGDRQPGGARNAQSRGSRYLHLSVPVDRQLGIDHRQQRDGCRRNIRGETG